LGKEWCGEHWHTTGDIAEGIVENASANIVKVDINALGAIRSDLIRNVLA